MSGEWEVVSGEWLRPLLLRQPTADCGLWTADRGPWTVS